MYEKVKTAIVGCGAISDIYFTNMMQQNTSVDVVACCAKHMESANRKAEQYGVKATTFEEILTDASIEMVVILTPAPTHYELISRALKAGKHVFTEKPLTDKLEDGEKLVHLANEKRLYLGAAPETFLGSCFQTARKAIEDGLIGEVTSFHICGNRDLDIFASAYRSLRVPGGGICFDYGVYYLTALVSLLGPVDKVFALVKKWKKERINIYPESPEYGKTYIYDNESQVTAVVQMESGVMGNFGLNGDSNVKDLGEFMIYGTKGVLRLGDANLFGGKVTFIPNDHDMSHWDWDTSRVLEDISPISENHRGIGPAEMAYAIRTGKGSRVSKEIPYHVLEIVSKIMQSSESGKMETVESTCQRPELLEDWKEFMNL